MQARNLLGQQFLFTRGNFEGLPAGYLMGQAAAPPAVVVTPPPPIVVTPPGPSLVASVGTLALLGGGAFVILELTGVTKVTGMRKILKKK